jgi:Spy/CpxP family protein refolding chaperone
MVTAKQARWTGMVLLLITFAAGGLVGAATLHVVEADEVATPQRERRPDLFERLDLTPEQQAQVDAIMERRRQEMDAFWREHGPTMRAIYDSTRMEVRAILTPEQVQLEEQFRSERQKQFEMRREREKTR